MIYTLLQSIPGDFSKATLKLELQKKIIQVKYRGYQAVLSSSAPDLHQALQASTKNYFEVISPPSVQSPSESFVSKEFLRELPG